MHCYITKALNVLTGTIQTLVQTGALICIHCNLKLILNAAQREKIGMVQWTIGFMLEGYREEVEATMKEGNHMLTVDIDEKWFFCMT